MRGAGRPAAAAASVIVGTACAGERRGPGHPRGGPVGHPRRELEHLRAQRGDQHGHRRRAPDRDAAVRVQRLAVERHLPARARAASGSRGTRACGGRACRTRAPRSPSTTIWCDSPIPSVRRPPLIACTVSACWASVIGWRGIRRHDRGAELDARHLPPDDAEHGQRVEAEDLREPVARRSRRRPRPGPRRRRRRSCARPCRPRRCRSACVLPSCVRLAASTRTVEPPASSCARDSRSA